MTGVVPTPRRDGTEREQLGAGGEAVGFFAMRTPLLPISVLSELGELVRASTAKNEEELVDMLAEDRTRLRVRLRQIARDEAFQEGVYLSSSEFAEKMRSWSISANADLGLERTVLKYVLRACSRATPFGIFAAVSHGRFDTVGATSVPEQHEWYRRTRVDSGVLSAVCAASAERPDVLSNLVFRPSPSIYRVGDQLRYSSHHATGRFRRYALSAVDVSEFIDCVIDAAREGAKLKELAQSLASRAVLGDEADEFVREMVDAQLLVHDLELVVTGEDPTSQTVERLRASPEGAAAAELLGNAIRECSKLDARGVGLSHDQYADLISQLRLLPQTVELPDSELIQVDLFTRTDALSLPMQVAEDLGRAADLLWRVAAEMRPHSSFNEMLDTFREAFVERFGDAEVPLLMALDEEDGVPWHSPTPPSDDVPLLEGVDLPRAPAIGRTSAFNTQLNEALGRRADTTVREVEFDETVLRTRADTLTHFRPLPNSFAVFARLQARDEDALNAGDYRLQIDTVYGPSGAVPLARFCYGHPKLRSAVEDMLRVEEAVEPDVLFAELVHLPQGRFGNFILRPCLRGFELPYLGTSGSSPENQLAIGDLTIAVRSGRLVLKSTSLQRRVAVRISTAHNPDYGAGLPVYRFLHALQHQGTAHVGMTLPNTPENAFQPRLVSGRLVLALAKWVVSENELLDMFSESDAQRFSAVQRVRRERGIDRFVSLMDTQGPLVLDLENIMCIEELGRRVRSAKRVELSEVFPGIEQSPTRRGNEVFTHEFVFPMKRSELKQSMPRSAATAPKKERSGSMSGYRRRFAPGSEWLYAKVFLGAVSADRLLGVHLREPIEDLIDRGIVRKFFFIRYADPKHHLRLRFEGDPAELLRSVIPMLHERIWNGNDGDAVAAVQYDTYVRETERYGGPGCMREIESIFHHDSIATMRMLETIREGALEQLRWRTALIAIDSMLCAGGFDSEGREQLFGVLRNGLTPHLSRDKNVRAVLAKRFRSLRLELSNMVQGVETADIPAAVRSVLRTRDDSIRPHLDVVRSIVASSPGGVSFDSVAGSLVHMCVNRILRSSHREQEFVLYDLLHQALRTNRFQRQSTK